MTDASGRPLADVTLELGAEPLDGRVPLARVRTTPPGGQFAIDRVPPGRYRLRAHHLAHGPVARVVDVAAGARVIVDLQLPPLATLQGRIQDTQGTAVPLAHVVAVPVVAGVETSDPTEVQRSRSDTDGRFRLATLAPGQYRLLIDAPGLGAATAGPLTAPDPDVVVVLPGASRSITGTVTLAGRGVAGARVHLGGEGLAETRTVDSDGSGHFAFAGVGPGTYAARAELRTMVSPVVPEIVVGASSAQRQVELMLGESVTFHGRVLDEKGEGVPGATVRVDVVPPTGLWSTADSDAAGRWTSAPVGVGHYQLRARRPGFTPRRTAVADVVRPGGLADPLPPAAVTLDLVRNGRIVGTVVDQDGHPVAGARVHDRAAEVEDLGVIWAPLPLASEAAALPVGSLSALSEGRAPSRLALTDAAGKFELADVPPGRLQLEILEQAAVPYRGKPVLLAPGAALDAGTVRLVAGLRVSGRVVDERDQPVAGARVSARARGAAAGAATAALYAVTDAQGLFSLPVALGELTLIASAPKRGDVQTAITARAPGPLPPVVMMFGPSSSARSASAGERSAQR